ncbi:hypothetical protein QCA50_008063 [Cerrena zonata]|uniref:Uncharacterized protein n=1 Tax=Cerrena zonata TaxID=2478898 RepID=A0AAW0GHV5_9APHY
MSSRLNAAAEAAAPEGNTSTASGDSRVQTPAPGEAHPASNANDNPTTNTNDRSAEDDDNAPVVIQCLVEDVPAAEEYARYLAERLRVLDALEALEAASSHDDRDNVPHVEPDGFIPEHLKVVFQPPAKVMPPEAISGNLSVPPSPAKNNKSKGEAGTVEMTDHPMNEEVVTVLSPATTPVGPSRKRLRIELSPTNSEEARESVPPLPVALPRSSSPGNDNPFLATIEPGQAAIVGLVGTNATTPNNAPAKTTFARTGNVPLTDIEAHFSPTSLFTNNLVTAAIQTMTFMQILRSLIPPVYDGKPFRLFEHMRNTQILDWWKDCRDAVIIQVFGTNAWNEDTPYILTMLTNTLRGLVGLPSPNLAAPNPPADIRSYRPSSFLLVRPPKAVYDRLVEQFCWSTPDIAFFAYKMEFSLPRYIGPFVGFTTADVDHVRDAFTRHIGSDATRMHVNFYRSSNNAIRSMPLDDIMAALLNSIEVDTFYIAECNRPEILVANLYIDSPTNDASQWLGWQAHLRNIVYTTQFHGNGVKRDLFKCSGCHGDDHPRGKCPFPQLEGWLTRSPRFNTNNNNNGNGGPGGPSGGGSGPSTPRNDSNKNFYPGNRRGYREGIF